MDRLNHINSQLDIMILPRSNDEMVELEDRYKLVRSWSCVGYSRDIHESAGPGTKYIVEPKG